MSTGAQRGDVAWPGRRPLGPWTRGPSCPERQWEAGSCCCLQGSCPWAFSSGASHRPARDAAFASWAVEGTRESHFEQIQSFPCGLTLQANPHSHCGSQQCTAGGRYRAMRTPPPCAVRSGPKQGPALLGGPHLPWLWWFPDPLQQSAQCRACLRESAAGGAGFVPASGLEDSEL